LGQLCATGIHQNLLLFQNFEGSETSAGMSTEAMKAQLKDLSNVQRHAVVGAPGPAEAMINLVDKIIPVDAETFDASEVDRAWAFVGARPL